MDTTEMGEPVGMVGSGGAARIVQTHQASSSQPDFASSLAYHSPHHQYIYSTGGAADFTIPQQFPPEFSSYSTSDVHWNVAAHHAQHLHGQNFAPQDGLPQFGSQYSPQVQIPQQQQEFSNAYSSASQPITIAPSQLGGSSFPTQTTTVSPSELWVELGDAPSQAKRSHPNLRTRQKPEASGLSSINITVPALPPNPIKLKGCPWITVVTEGIDPRLIRAFLPHSCNRLRANTSTEALQNVNLVNEPVPAAPPQKKIKLTTATTAAAAAKTHPPQKTAAKASQGPKIPDDPIERIKYLVHDAFNCDEDIEDIREASKKLWEIMLKVPLEQPKLVEVVVWSILKFGDDVILQHLGSSILFAVRLRYWMTTEWNRDKTSPTVLMLLRVSYIIAYCGMYNSACNSQLELCTLRYACIPIITERVSHIFTGVEKISRYPGTT